MSLIEKPVTVLLMGLNPPFPPELQPEFHEFTAEKQREERRVHLRKVVRWQYIIAGVVVVMIVKWLWECGVLALLWIGFSPGFAHATDITSLQQEIAASNVTQSAKLDALLTRDIVEKIATYRLRQCKALLMADEMEAELFGRLLDAEIERYNAITKRGYTVRACPGAP